LYDRELSHYPHQCSDQEHKMRLATNIKVKVKYYSKSYKENTQIILIVAKIVNNRKKHTKRPNGTDKDYLT